VRTYERDSPGAFRKGPYVTVLAEMLVDVLLLGHRPDGLMAFLENLCGFEIPRSDLFCYAVFDALEYFLVFAGTENPLLPQWYRHIRLRPRA